MENCHRECSSTVWHSWYKRLSMCAFSKFCRADGLQDGSKALKFGAREKTNRSGHSPCTILYFYIVHFQQDCSSTPGPCRTFRKHKNIHKQTDSTPLLPLATVQSFTSGSIMDVTPEMQKAVQAVLDDTSVPLLSRWQRVADKLVEGGLAWRAKLQASSMLVHNHNRGGLGVSGHGCHLKGEALAKSGFGREIPAFSCVLLGCCEFVVQFASCTKRELKTAVYLPVCCMRFRNQPRAEPTG